MSKQPATSRPEWIDETLAVLMRGNQVLPVFTAERSRAEQHKRLMMITGTAAISLIVIFMAAFIFTGIPYRPDIYLVVGVAVPVGVMALLHGIFYLAVVRGRRDDAVHPRKFYADAKGMSIEHADGARYGAPWAQWRYSGYVYGSVRNQARFVRGLDLLLDGRHVSIDLIRIPRGHRLGRAILQQLAAAEAGHSAPAAAPAASPPGPVSRH